MALSEKELRMLEQMERALVEEDPKLASTLRGSTIERTARTRAVIAGVLFLGGVCLLLGGVILRSNDSDGLVHVILGVIGFIVMLGAATLAVTALRATPGDGSSEESAAPRETGRDGFGVVDGGKRPKPGKTRRPRGRASGGASQGSMMERFEERWRRRRERGL